MSPWLVVALALTTGAAEQAATPEDEGPPPSKQTLLFYNARISLREGRPAEVLKLWLLRNSIANQGFGGRYDEEFRSVVWAAMGNLGLCQDGYPKDLEGGAGLWPLSLFNWVLYASRGLPSGPRNPYDAFEAGRQQRYVSLYSVMSTAELRTVNFFRTSCYLPETTLIALGKSPSLDLTDRLSTGPFLRQLLVMSLKSLVREKVQSVAAIEARIFDLDLAMAQLLERKARRAGLAAQQRAKVLGISAAGAEENKKKAMEWPANSSQAAFLRKALTWKVSEWMVLNRQRRLFLFSQARSFAKSDELDPLVLSMIDSMIDRGEGGELESWIGNFDATLSQPRRAALTLGERGKRLLELEPSTGFHERATVALHRGVAFLEAGSLQEALRSFAYAMQKSEESRDAAVTMSLSRRWVSYVLSRYETNEQVIATLKALVPKQEYNSVVEDLLWHAALRADEKSFELVVSSLQRGSALDARVARMRLLAQGKQGILATQMRDATVDEPHLTLRFARQLLEKLEAEDIDVRRANIPLLRLYSQIFDSLLMSKGGTAKAQARAAEELIARAQGILGGLSLFDKSVVGKARELSPQHETFAGNIRLAPSDQLPWPFEPPVAEPPSAFTPLVLWPVERRDEKGGLVFGWKVTD